MFWLIFVILCLKLEKIGKRYLCFFISCHFLNIGIVYIFASFKFLYNCLNVNALFDIARTAFLGVCFIKLPHVFIYAYIQPLNALINFFCAKVSVFRINRLEFAPINVVPMSRTF